MEYTIYSLAQAVSGQVVGDGNTLIYDTRSLEQAVEGTITFAIGEYVDYVPQVKASAVIVEKAIPEAPMTQIVVPNAKVAFARILELFHPPVIIDRVVHPTAVIGDHVKMGKNVAIGAYAVIADNVTIGDNVTIYPHTYIGHNSRIGDDTTIYTGAIIHENCVFGQRVVIRANAVIGGEGFGFATENGKHRHIPQVGNVILEDDVEVGSCTCIDNATMGSTMVRRGTKIDNLVHLGHNVEIGEDCFIIAQVGIAGSAKCGNHVTFAGQTGCTGHITIGDNVTFAAKTGIIGNVASDGVYAGFPMRPHKQWLKVAAYENRLPEMAKMIKQLQKEVEQLKAKKEDK